MSDSIKKYSEMMEDKNTSTSYPVGKSLLLFPTAESNCTLCSNLKPNVMREIQGIRCVRTVSKRKRRNIFRKETILGVYTTIEVNYGDGWVEIPSKVKIKWAD